MTGAWAGTMTGANFSTAHGPLALRRARAT